MTKTILITGATDGIGLLTAQKLASAGHKILLHGRNRDKLKNAAAAVGGAVETYLADLSDLTETAAMAAAIRTGHTRLDVLINNAGVLRVPDPGTLSGLDARFVVNTLAPYLLTRELLDIMPADGRVINLSSAAQAPVSVRAMKNGVVADDMSAYAQSKLAITIWTQELAAELPDGPDILAVNPGSLLASKMVKEGFGIAGNDLSIGANILIKASLDPSFAKHSGRYFDNDAGCFADPHTAALSAEHRRAVMQAVQQLSSIG